MPSDPRTRGLPPFAGVLVLLLGTLPLGGAALQDPPPQGTPRIIVPEETANWGRLLRGDVFEHSFAVRNDGDATLVIEKVTST